MRIDARWWLGVCVACLLAAGPLACSSGGGGGGGGEPSGGSLLGGLRGNTAGYGGGDQFRAVELSRLNREELRALTQALGGFAMGMPADEQYDTTAAAVGEGAGEVGGAGDAVGGAGSSAGVAGRGPLLDADTNDDGIVTPDEILGMVRVGYSQNDIVAALERTDAAFVLTPAEVDQLADAAVPESLIEKLRQVSSQQRARLMAEGRRRAAASVTTP